MHFLLLCGRAPTLSNAIRHYPRPLKNCKTWKNAFFAGFREGFNAIQRYPSLSQTLEKLQNLEKSIFCCCAGGRKTWKNGKTWKNAFFAALRRAPTLSNATRPYPRPYRKNSNPGKMHFLLFCGRAKTWKNCKTWKNAFFAALREGPNPIQRYPSLSQTLEKLQNLEKCIFCWFPGRPQRYPTLSVLIPDPRKIAKPGKMHFWLVCGRAKTWKNCKTWKNVFFAALREGPNAIQRYPSLSQTLEKLQNLEKCIFGYFAGGRKTLEKLQNLQNAFFSGFREGPIQRYPSLSQTLEKLQNLEKKTFFAVLREVAKLWKNGKTWKNAFFAALRRAPTLSNATRPYPRPYRKNSKPGKMHFLLFCGRSKDLGKIAKPGKMHFFLFAGRPQRYPTPSVLIPDPRKIAKTWKNEFFPRASERRVLPIVGVCKTSSHLHIFSSSHPLIFTSSHFHIFTSSHPHIFTSAHLHICSSSHLLIFTSAHLHICSSSHLLIFTSSHPHIFPSSHPHIFSSSHLLIFTSAHLHICSSSHLLIFTSTHLYIFSSSHLPIFTSSHLLIFTSSHLLIFTSSHLHRCSSSHLLTLTSSHLHIFSSRPLALLPSPSFLFLSWRRGAGAVPTRRHETQPFRTKWSSIAKNCGKIVISTCPAQPFRTKWGSIAKNCGQIAISTCPAQPFRTKWGSIAKNWGKIAISKLSGEVCKSVCVQKRLCVKVSVCVKVFVCKSVCV